MPGTEIAQVQDEELRLLMAQAEARLDEGENSACVHACAEAYLRVLAKYPAVLTGLRTVLATPRVRAGLANGTLRFAPLLFPRLAAKLSVPDDGTPTVTFTREQIAFGEAVQYFEFTLNLIADAQRGTIRVSDGAS